MRDETAIFIGVFLVFLLIVAALAYFGWDRWEPVPQR